MARTTSISVHGASPRMPEPANESNHGFTSSGELPSGQATSINALIVLSASEPETDLGIFPTDHRKLEPNGGGNVTNSAKPSWL